MEAGILRLDISQCACAVLATFLLWSAPLAAQDETGCVRAEAADGSARQIFTCGGDLTFEREPNAALRIFRRTANPVPRRVDVEGGAILIDVTPGSAPTQIRTPHAIASVRGTTYVVDAGAEQTSVFVLDGLVAVRKPEDAATVNLRAGEGVDVAPGTPLEVRTWGAARVAALIARFGR